MDLSRSDRNFFFIFLLFWDSKYTTMLCTTWQILKPSEKKAKYQYGGLNSGRPVTPPRAPAIKKKWDTRQMIQWTSTTPPPHLPPPDTHTFSLFLHQTHKRQALTTSHNTIFPFLVLSFSLSFVCVCLGAGAVCSVALTFVSSSAAAVFCSPSLFLSLLPLSTS